MTTTIVSACDDLETAKYAQDIYEHMCMCLFKHGCDRVQSSVSIENIIALASGISTGVYYGDNDIPVAMILAERYRVDMPLITSVDDVVNKGADSGKIVKILTAREKTELQEHKLQEYRHEKSYYIRNI